MKALFRLAVFTLLISVTPLSLAVEGLCGNPKSFFVNGIRTSEEEGLRSAAQLTKILKRDLEKGEQVELLYNHSISMSADLAESLYQQGVSYSLREERAAQLLNQLISDGSGGTSDAPPEYLESARVQISSAILYLLNNPKQIERTYAETLGSMLKETRAFLKSKPGIYLVGHSQGTLFVNDVFRSLSTNELAPGKKARKHSRGIFVAPAAFRMEAPFIDWYFKFNEDVLSKLGIGLPGTNQQFSTFEAEDPWHNSVGDSTLNHSFLGTYLNESAARESNAFAVPFNAILGRMKSDLKAIRAPCEEYVFEDNNGEFLLNSDAEQVHSLLECFYTLADVKILGREYNMSAVDLSSPTRALCSALSETWIPEPEFWKQSPDWPTWTGCAIGEDSAQCVSHKKSSLRHVQRLADNLWYDAPANVRSYDMLYDKLEATEQCSSDDFEVVHLDESRSCKTWTQVMREWLQAI